MINLGNTVGNFIRNNSQIQTIECDFIFAYRHPDFIFAYRHPAFGLIKKFVFIPVFLPIFGFLNHVVPFRTPLSKQ